MNPKYLNGAFAALYLVTAIVTILFIIVGCMMFSSGAVALGIVVVIAGLIGAGFSIWQLVKYLKVMFKA